jgi:hypothetical protein
LGTSFYLFLHIVSPGLQLQSRQTFYNMCISRDRKSEKASQEQSLSFPWPSFRSQVASLLPYCTGQSTHEPPGWRCLGHWVYALEDDYGTLACSSSSSLLPGHAMGGFADVDLPSYMSSV